MSGVIATIPKYQFSSNGVPMVDGTLETYLAGSTTPEPTYQNQALSIANTNPIVLDSRGECVLWLDSTKQYKFILKNKQGAIQWTQDNISGATGGNFMSDLAASSGASLVGLAQGGKVQDAIKWVTPEMFVGATDLIKLHACADYAETNNVWMVVDDHASNYDLGGGTLLLPRKFTGHVRTDSDARGHLFQNGTVTLRTKSHPMVSGVDADTFRCEGLQKGYVHTVRANTFVLDGYNTSWGLFWVNFKDITAGTTTFDLSNFAINANTFENLVSGVTGSYAVNITDNGYAGPNYRECHDNVFITCDFAHSRGVINQSNLNQTNYIIGGYAEDIDAGYKAFSGNFDVSGCNSDTGGVPAVGLLNHVQGMATQIERTGGDFLSMPNESLVVADWSALDSNGKPPAISGSAGCSVVSDGSMPGSSGARYGNTTSTAFDNVKLTLPIIASGTAYPRFSVAGFWYGDLPAAIEVNNGDGSVASYDASSFVSLGSNYYLFRLTGYASSSGTTTVTFFITTSATSRTGYIGACYVSPYKAAPLPYKSALNQNVVSWESGGLLHQKGTASQGYVAASPVTVGITFPKSFTNLSSVTPVVTPIAMTGFGGKMTKFEIKEDSITVNGFSVDVHFSGDWAGTIIWQASGV